MTPLIPIHLLTRSCKFPLKEEGYSYNFHYLWLLSVVPHVNRDLYVLDVNNKSYTYKIILTHCMSFAKTECLLFKRTTIADIKVLILSIDKKLASFYLHDIMYVDGKSCGRNKSI